MDMVLFDLAICKQGDIAYEREMTGEFKKLLHIMLSTIYVIGVGLKLSVGLQAIEDDDLNADHYRYRANLITMDCEKAKEEAQVFLEQ